jgi:hypothetical protein
MLRSVPGNGTKSLQPDLYVPGSIAPRTISRVSLSRAELGRTADGLVKDCGSAVEFRGLGVAFRVFPW